MSDDLSMKENGVEGSCSENLPESKEHLPLPSTGCALSSESAVASSDSGSENLHMTSGDFDTRSLRESQEEAEAASTVAEMPDSSPAQASTPGQASTSRDKAASSLEGKEESKTIEKHRKECATGGKSCLLFIPCEVLLRADSF